MLISLRNMYSFFLFYLFFGGFFYPHKLIRLTASERSERGHPVAVCAATENGEWWVVVTHFTFIFCPHETKTSQNRPQQRNDSSGSDQKKPTTDVNSRRKTGPWYAAMEKNGNQNTASRFQSSVSRCASVDVRSWGEKTENSGDVCVSYARDSALILQMVLKFSEKLSIMVIMTLISVSISL